MILHLLLSLFLSHAETDTESLEPILIEDIDPSGPTSAPPRSVHWPTQDRPSNSSFFSPQLNDGLNLLNGVQARTQGSPSLSLRGSGQSGRSLVLFKDIPLQFATGFGPPSLFLAKELISEVQVIKGPASLFYGSQALAGSLNLRSQRAQTPKITLTASDTDESGLPWRHGGLAHNSIHLLSPIWQSEKSHWQISYFNENDDGEFPFAVRDQKGVRSFNANNLGRVVVEGENRGRNWLLESTAIVGREIRQSPGSLSLPLNTREESEGLLVSLAPQVFLSPQTHVRSQISYLDQESQFQDATGPSFSRPQSLIMQNEWSTEFSPQSQLQFFVDGFQQSFSASFLPEEKSLHFVEFGPFLSFQPGIEGWIVKTGGRYLPSADRLLPTAALHRQWVFVESWLSYGEGFRNPSLSDLFSQTPFFRGNSALRPELSQQVELGIKGSRQHSFAKLGFDARVFHMDYQDFIETVQTSPGVFSRANLGRGLSKGAEIEFSVSNERWRVETHYNFLHTRNAATGEAFRLSPQHQWGLQGSYQLNPRNRVNVQKMSWWDTFDQNGNQLVRLQDWSQWNLFWTYQASGNLSVQAGVINAFNAQRELGFDFPEPGRRYYLQLSWKLATTSKEN